MTLPCFTVRQRFRFNINKILTLSARSSLEHRCRRDIQESGTALTSAINTIFYSMKYRTSVQQSITTVITTVFYCSDRWIQYSRAKINIYHTCIPPPHRSNARSCRTNWAKAAISSSLGNHQSRWRHPYAITHIGALIHELFAQTTGTTLGEVLETLKTIFNKNFQLRFTICSSVRWALWIRSGNGSIVQNI